MHQVVWHPKAKKTISGFPQEVKDKMGYLIFRMQMGDLLTLPHSRKMEDVGKGVRELRVKGSDGIYRSFYVSVAGSKIYVFHSFKKKTQKTAKSDIEQGKKNLKEVKTWLDQK